MIALGFRFLAGRYHATGWDHHVNEGTVEWPPSPWRVLRALVAASYKVVPTIGSDRVRSALSPLRALPVYDVPAAGVGHTRHYMPLGNHRTGMTGETTLVFDAFAAPGRDAELVVAWPDAAESDPAALDAIVGCLGYLGRSESWVEARRLPAWSGRFNAAPADQGGSGFPTKVKLNALSPDDQYQSWRSALDEDVRESESSHPKKLATRSARKPHAPADWWEVLHLDTGILEKDAWSAPPGVRRIDYGLAQEPFRSPRAVSSRRVGSRPTIARFALKSAVMPPCPQALPIGERMRQALMSWSRDKPETLALFAGKDAAGARLTGHQHAFFLPADDDHDGRLDHLVVWARGGFSTEAIEVLQQIRRLWGSGGHDIGVVLVGLGHPRDYGGLVSESALGKSSQLGPARVWESATPFVPPRHTKDRRGRLLDSPEEQVRKLLVDLGLPEVTRIEALGTRWHRFVRVRRSGGGARAGSTGYGARLYFAEPITGPVVVGYGAHQGLGQFIAVR